MRIQTLLSLPFLLLLLSLFGSCTQKNMQKEIIKNYLHSYNNFDVEGMMKDFDESIEFKNISNGVVDTHLFGMEEFRKQAELAKNFFSYRNQEVESWEIKKDEITITIAYTGVLAMDIPDGPKSGDTLSLKGKSTFIFKDHKIISITDES
jgi:hypothetical protein